MVASDGYSEEAEVLSKECGALINLDAGFVPLRVYRNSQFPKSRREHVGTWNTLSAREPNCPFSSKVSRSRKYQRKIITAYAVLGLGSKVGR